MKLVWTKSNSTVSSLIRFITGECCSHFGIVLYNGKPGEIMFESNFLGTHPRFYHSYLKSNSIVHEIEFPMSIENEDLIWDKIVNEYDGKGYDFSGAIYLGFRRLLNKYLRIPMPTKNKLSDPNKYFCNELYEIVSGVHGIPLIPMSDSMMTPHDVWRKFNEQ